VKATRFQVRGEDGQIFTVVESVQMLDVSSFDDPNAPPIEGLHSVRTTTGLAVNRLSDTEFEILFAAKNGDSLKAKRI
jgi:hypothetical protein